MVAQQALSPQIQRRKATIPWMDTRVGAPISKMNEQLGLVRRWSVTVIPTHRVEMKLYRFDSCPGYKNKKNMKNDNIKALIGLVLALALVYVMGQILMNLI